MGARVKSDLMSKVVPMKLRQLQASALEMATDVHRRAIMLAPVETGALRNSGRVERLSLAAYRIIFGSDRVPYARRRHFENFKNPQTVRYLYRAGDSVKRERVGKYLRNK
jgi:hypothetical protein